LVLHFPAGFGIKKSPGVFPGLKFLMLGHQTMRQLRNPKNHLPHQTALPRKLVSLPKFFHRKSLGDGNFQAASNPIAQVPGFLATKKANLLNTRRLAFDLWSWRDSNPRPDKAPQRLLHAYPLLGFSSAGLVQWPTQLRLIS
jgi:hypothetical protein